MEELFRELEEEGIRKFIESHGAIARSIDEKIAASAVG